jgi:hypothetical protein
MGWTATSVEANKPEISKVDSNFDPFAEDKTITPKKAKSP